MAAAGVRGYNHAMETPAAGRSAGRFRTGLIPALLAVAVAAPATGAERREAGRHEHGTGELRVAIDGNDVEIELEGPASNFLGFEHQPATAAEQQALAAALAVLGAPDKLFVLPAAARCQLVGTEVTPPGFAAEEAAGEHAEEDGGHDDEDDEVHTEVAARYAFRCAQPSALDVVRLEVFARFPETARLEASVVAPAGQLGATLKPEAAVLKLRP
jgi:hypothetical protein